MATTVQDKKVYIWDTYWDSNLVHSLGVSVRGDVTAALDQWWAQLAQSLPPGAKVLDLACGNGAAALAMLPGQDSLVITGIDEALIAPAENVPEHAAALGKMTFKPRVQMEVLPFPAGTFDLVASQFGIEFSAQPERVLAEAARSLKPGGMLAVLALPAAGRAIQDARVAFKQARYLLANSNLFARALQMVKAYHASTDATAEEVMLKGLDLFCKEVEKTFGQFPESEVNVLSAIVFCLYQVFTYRRSTSNAEQMLAVETARTRLAHYAARAQAIVKAGQTDATMADLSTVLLSQGLKVLEAGPLVTPGHGVVALRLVARK